MLGFFFMYMDSISMNKKLNKITCGMRLLVLLCIPVALWWFCINASCPICRLPGDPKTTSSKMSQVSDLHANYISISETDIKLTS